MKARQIVPFLTESRKVEQIKFFEEEENSADDPVWRGARVYTTHRLQLNHNHLRQPMSRDP